MQAKTRRDNLGCVYIFMFTCISGRHAAFQKESVRQETDDRAVHMSPTVGDELSDLVSDKE